ncbi:Gfo/Idh/MocA family protein [Halarchaeum sp. P4]|uniref:Gfo/Idh/MocA family protein n=1 Tax=Halarchaeum sp. P4 TaxID=3421639 RepID=UPI003EBD5591
MTDTDSPVRVGIVGLGGIGNHHAEQLTDLGEDLVGGVDVVEEAREDFSERWGVPTYESYDALYEAGVDAVIITTPNKFHEQYAVQALESGVDVLLEKPLAHTLESAERIAAAAADAEGFCMVGFNNRFHPGVEVFKAEQSDGRFGDVMHVEANWVRRRGVPGRGGWFTTKEISGGGALIDIGVHIIDLALHVADFPEVVEVAGETRSEFGGREDYTYLSMWGEDSEEVSFDVDDSVTAYLRTEDGASIAVEVAWAANRPPKSEFSIQGSEAGATFDRESGDLTIHETSAAGAPHHEDTVVETRDVDIHQEEQQYFFDAVRAGEKPQRNTVKQGLQVQRVIDAIYRSSESGEAVRLD